VISSNERLEKLMIRIVFVFVVVVAAAVVMATLSASLHVSELGNRMTQPVTHFY
jgi:hypothetical protein